MANWRQATLLAIVAPFAFGPTLAEAEPAIILPAGTLVELETIAPLSSKRNVKGDLVPLRTTKDVTVNGQLAIPAGTPATGQVADARVKGALGMSGKLRVRPLFLKLGDQTVRLDGAASDKGGVAPEAVIGMIVLTPGLSGRSAEIPAATVIFGHVEREVPLYRP